MLAGAKAISIGCGNFIDPYAGPKTVEGIEDYLKRHNIDDVNDILQLNVIGAVPDDENIVVATNKGQPLVGDDSLAGQAYMNICRRITGEEIPFLDLNGKGGFFKKLSSLFKSDKKN